MDLTDASARFRIIRSKLFVPGSRPELFEKAMGSRADAVSFDLEDAVTEDKKGEARAAVASFLRRGPSGKLVIVRVNDLFSDLFEADIEALAGCGLDIVNLPKVDSQQDVVKAVSAIARAEKASGLAGRIGLLVNIETPRSLRLAHEIAAADPRIIGLQVGFIDLFARCGIDVRNTAAMQAVRLTVRFAAAEAGIATYDSAFADIKQPEAFRADAEDARRLGFEGKSCIHPSQIPIANEVFSPRADEVARAERILAAAHDAAEHGTGAFVADGQMIDRPIIARAHAVVALSRRLAMSHSS